MEAAFSSFHPRPPPSPASPALSSRRAHLPSFAPRRPFLPLSPLRDAPLRRGAAAAFWSWAPGGRKRREQGGGPDRASVEGLASIFVLVGAVRRLLATQPLDALAALLEAGDGARPGGGVLGVLRRRLSGGRARGRNRAWRRALELAIQVASAAAAAAAFWLLLVGKRPI